MARTQQVRVFTRFEDVSRPVYDLLHDEDVCARTGARVPLTCVNMAGFRERFCHDEVDRIFGECLDDFRPDVVHIHHLNHLSLGMVQVATQRGIPVVYTLHDFWLCCPRGQFVQASSEVGGEPLQLCTGQEDRKCAERCYQRSTTGVARLREAELQQMASWVRVRRELIQEIKQQVYRFLAPSRQLLDRMRSGLGLRDDQIQLLDYGFDLERLKGRRRVPRQDQEFVFGYIGTHVPAKGIGLIFEAARKIRGTLHLRIYGRPHAETAGMLAAHCRELADVSTVSVELMGEYVNEEIVARVFDQVDAIVMPSLWVENAPLVIHEALQCRVPVITADVGGMAEFVRHEENGLLFRHRDATSLAVQMQRLIDDPGLAHRLGQRGHWYSQDGQVSDISDHVGRIEQVYREAVAAKGQVVRNDAPWRITFDTNPDECNLKCVMCEEHSPYSKRQAERRACGQPVRRMDVNIFTSTLISLGHQAPREIIPSTMGEPLLYRDIDRIIAICRESGSRLNLTTNGTFPGRGARRWGQIILPLASDVKISMNGITDVVQEGVMQGFSADRLRDNLRAFVAVRDEIAATGGHRASITIQVTFMERNLAEIPALVRFALEVGADRVKGHHLWAHFAEIMEDDLRRSPEARVRWNRIADECAQIVENHVRAGGYRLKLENFDRLPETEISRRVPEDYECPFLGREAWVNHAGRFDPCCAPDEQRKKLGSFGSVTDPGGLLGIWNSVAYRDLVKNYKRYPLCQTCVMRRPRKGGVS